MPKKTFDLGQRQIIEEENRRKISKTILRARVGSNGNNK
jgi:hypothetical protein